MAEESILSSEVKSREHLRVFDELAAYRFQIMEVEKLLVYMIDTVDVDALPSLAEQFNLLGFNGWNSAQTIDDKRALIKKAIELHRYSGTPFAIRRALESVGCFDVEIEEGVGPIYDGFFIHDGTITYGEGNWATFRVAVDPGARTIDDVATAELTSLINAWKNARSKLVGLIYK
jgi:P2-related tail formation protein